MYDNPYDEETQPRTYDVWDQGWCAAYDELEQDWSRKVLPIVGDVEESIRYDWEHNDCVQVGKLKRIFDVFWQYAPEHDWLEPLVKDAVAAQNAGKWPLSYGARADLQFMGKAFGVELEED